MPKTLKLEEIFCLKSPRTILDGYFMRWKGKCIVIEEPFRRMLGRPAMVMLHFDGRMIIRYDGRDLSYREIPERQKHTQAEPAEATEIHTAPDASLAAASDQRSVTLFSRGDLARGKSGKIHFVRKQEYSQWLARGIWIDIQAAHELSL